MSDITVTQRIQKIVVDVAAGSVRMVGGQPIAKSGGVQTFDNLAQLQNQWPDPPDGALCVLSNNAMVLRRIPNEWVPVSGAQAHMGSQNSGALTVGQEYQWTPLTQKELNQGWLLLNDYKDLMCPWSGWYSVEIQSHVISDTAAGYGVLSVNGGTVDTVQAIVGGWNCLTLSAKVLRPGGSVIRVSWGGEFQVNASLAGGRTRMAVSYIDPDL